MPVCGGAEVSKVPRAPPVENWPEGGEDQSGPPVNQLGLRYCLVLDWFAYHFNQEANRQQPGFGNLPFFQQQMVAARAGRYGPLAGFSDPEVLGGYVAQGANTIFLVMANRNQFERHHRF